MKPRFGRASHIPMYCGPLTKSVDGLECARDTMQIGILLRDLDSLVTQLNVLLLYGNLIRTMRAGMLLKAKFRLIGAIIMNKMLMSSENEQTKGA